MSDKEKRGNGLAAGVGVIGGGAGLGYMAHQHQGYALVNRARLGEGEQKIIDAVRKGLHETGLHDSHILANLTSANKVKKIVIHKGAETSQIESVTVHYGAFGRHKRTLLSTDLPDTVKKLLNADKDQIIRGEELGPFLQKLEKGINRRVLGSNAFKEAGGVFRNLSGMGKGIVVGSTALGAVIGGSVLNAVFAGPNQRYAQQIDMQRAQAAQDIERS